MKITWPEGSYKERKWYDTLEKISFYPPSSNYYENLPVQPGVHLFKEILTSKVPLSTLQLKIPESLCTFFDTFWLRYDYNTGSIKVEPEDFLLRNFGDSLYKTDKEVYGHDCGDKEPAVMEHTEYSRTVLDWEKFKDKMGFGADMNSVV